MTTSWIFFSGLVALSMLLAMMEVVLLSLSKIKAQQLLEKNKKIEAFLNLWVKHTKHILATIFTLSILCHTGIVLQIYKSLERLISKQFSQPVFICVTVVMSYIVIGMSSIVPKLIARGRPELLPLRFIQIMYYISFILWIPNELFLRLTRSISRFIGIPDLNNTLITEEEIKTIIEMGEQEGTVEESERKMIHSIFDFGDTIVREVMSPRVDMVCISVGSTLIEAVEVIKVNHHSRIPVFKENIDNIVGVLYAKDILDYIDNDNFKKKMVRDVMHQPLFVPETKLINELLHELRETKTHLAIAVDEYGGTAGIVTIEDILEEIIGEILDEYDTDEEALFFEQNENQYIFDAKISITEFKELFNINRTLKDEGDYDTLGGYVFSLLGRIPTSGEKFEDENIAFEVLDADEKRLITLKVTLLEKKDDSAITNTEKGE